MIQLTPVVKNLLIINVFVFIIFNVVSPHLFNYLPLYYPEKQAHLEKYYDDLEKDKKNIKEYKIAQLKAHNDTLPKEAAQEIENAERIISRNEESLAENAYFFQPYQLLTNMFTHFSGQHIFFNMLSLMIFGSAIEMFWGGRRFLFYYLFAGLGAAILSLIMTYVSVHNFGGSPFVAMAGASGCIFGLLAAYGLLFPDNIIQMLFPPIQLKAKYYVLIFGVIEFYGGIRQLNPNLGGGGDNIGHFAHLGGAIFGALLILYWRKGGSIGKNL